MKRENYTRGELVTVNGIKCAVVKSLGGSDWKIREILRGRISAVSAGKMVRLSIAGDGSTVASPQTPVGAPVVSALHIKGSTVVLKAGPPVAAPVAAPDLPDLPTLDPDAEDAVSEKTPEKKSLMGKLFNKE
jgi:hypothetical protein